MDCWEACPKLKQTRTQFLLEGQVVLSWVTGFHPGVHEKAKGLHGTLFLFFLSFNFLLTFSRLRRAGCYFCFPLPRWDRPVSSLCPQSLWQPGQFWWCCCRAHLPKRCCRGFLLQLILDPYTSPAETTQEFWLRCHHFLCPPWFKLVTSITYPWICKLHLVF